MMNKLTQGAEERVGKLGKGYSSRESEQLEGYMRYLNLIHRDLGAEPE